MCVCVYIYGYMVVAIASQSPHNLYRRSLRHAKSLPVSTLPSWLPVGHKTIRLVHSTAGFI